MMETRKAILLIDAQNEFISKDGKLYNNVAEVLEDTKMLEKLPPFIKQARDASTVIIHSPLSINPNNPEHSELNLPGLFEEGSWNAEFAVGFKPAKRDYIMSPRKKFCCFGGSKLLTLLRRERIDVLFIGGFLTDGSILETVKAANALGLHSQGLEIYVLRDGCSTSSSKRQEEMMCHILPLHCDIITIKEAFLMIEQGLSKVLRTSEGIQSEMFDPVKLLRQEMIDKWFKVERLVDFLGSPDTVSKAEFEDVLVELNLASAIGSKKVFHVLDKEGSGEISTKVLLEALRPRVDDVLITKTETATSTKPSLSIGLIADNQTKVSLMKFLQDHITFFRNVKFVTNKSIARVLEKSMGLSVEDQVSNIGCEREISALLVQRKICAIFLLTEQAEILNRDCCIHNVPFANNPMTARAVVSMLANSSSGYSCLTGNNPAYRTSLTFSESPGNGAKVPLGKIKKKASKKSKKEKRLSLKGNVSQRLNSSNDEPNASNSSLEQQTLSDKLNEDSSNKDGKEGRSIQDEPTAQTEEISIQGPMKGELPIQDEPVHALGEPDVEENDPRRGGLLQALSFRKPSSDRGSQASDTVSIPDAIIDAASTSTRIESRKKRIEKYIKDGKPNIAKKMITSTLAEINGLGMSTLAKK